MMSDLEKLADTPEARNALHAILRRCFDVDATELIIEPVETKISIRNANGVIRLKPLPIQLFWAIIVRLRVMADLGLELGVTDNWGDFELTFEEIKHRFVVTVRPVLGGEDLIVAIPKLQLPP